MATGARREEVVHAAHVRAARPGRRTSGRPPPISRSPRWYQPGPASTAIISPSPRLGAIPIRIFLERAFVGRVDTEDAAASADPGHDELLALLLFIPRLDDDFGDGSRNNQDAFPIADDDIAGQDRYATAADRHVDVLGVVDGGRDDRAHAARVRGQVDC